MWQRHILYNEDTVCPKIKNELFSYMKSRDNELQYGGKPTAEQLRKRKKAVTLDEGPRSPQVCCGYPNHIFWTLYTKPLPQVKTTIPFLVIVITPFLVDTTPFLAATYHFLYSPFPFPCSHSQNYFLRSHNLFMLAATLY